MDRRVLDVHAVKQRHLNVLHGNWWGRLPTEMWPAISLSESQQELNDLQQPPSKSTVCCRKCLWLFRKLPVFQSTICLGPNKVESITLVRLFLQNFLREPRSDAYLQPACVDSEYANHQLIEGVWRWENALLPVASKGERRRSVKHFRSIFFSPAELSPT